jgi:hypothetical protein
VARVNAEQRNAADPGPDPHADAYADANATPALKTSQLLLITLDWLSWHWTGVSRVSSGGLNV